MMSVTPTCRYCHKQLTGGMGFDQVANDPLYEYKCEPCHSIQSFEADGKCVYWQFRVGLYRLRFDAYQQVFKILRLVAPTDTAIAYHPPALTLNYLPNSLTPQTCTEARIKTLILFS